MRVKSDSSQSSGNGAHRDAINASADVIIRSIRKSELKICSACRISEVTNTSEKSCRFVQSIICVFRSAKSVIDPLPLCYGRGTARAEPFLSTTIWEGNRYAYPSRTHYRPQQAENKTRLHRHIDLRSLESDA